MRWCSLRCGSMMLFILMTLPARVCVTQVPYTLGYDLGKGKTTDTVTK